MVFQENGETYYTVKEACQKLGITRQSLDGYVDRGKLTKYRRGLGRTVFFKKSEIDELAEIRPVDGNEQEDED